MHSGKILGEALASILRTVLDESAVRRVCVCGGDTSGYLARALGIEALEVVMPLAPGAPICRVYASDAPLDGLQVVFKGGQAGTDDFLQSVQRGRR